MSAPTNQTFTSCLFEAHKILPERFKMRGDGRKWKRLVEARRVLFNELASFANADGTRIYPSVETIAKRLLWSRRKIFIYLADLEKLGCMVNAGRTGQRGTMMRSLTPPAEKTKSRKPPETEQLEPKPDSSQCKIRSNSAGFTSQGARFESNGAGLDSHSASMSAHNLPLDLPNKPALPTMPSKNGLVGWMARDFGKATGKMLNRKAGKVELQTLADSVGDARIKTVWSYWVRNRNLEGMECPLVHFVNEFEATEAILEKHTEDAQAAKDKKEGRTKVSRQVEESERKRREWRIGLEAAEDIDAYIAENPCPPYYVNINGKLETLASDGPELIENARHRLANPILTKEQRKAMAEAAFL